MRALVCEQWLSSGYVMLLYVMMTGGGSDVISREISRIEQQWKDWNSFTGVEVWLHLSTFTAVSFLEH